MPASCVIPDCDLKYTHSDDVSFHKFPLKSPELLKQWIQFTGRDQNWYPTKWSALCSRHFVASDFKGCASRKILLPTAAPSIRNVSVASKAQSNHHLSSLSVISYETVCPEEERARHLDHYLPVELDVTLLGGTSLCPVVASEMGEEFGTDADGDVQLIEITCRVCGVVFSRAVENLLVDIVQSEEVVRKYLPFVNLDLPNLPRKICMHCSKVVNGFGKFSETVLHAQADLEHRFAQELHGTLAPPNMFAGARTKQETVTGKPMNIKQEPIASLNIKEEKIEYAMNSARQKDLTPIAESIDPPPPPVIIKNQTFTSDSSRIYLFNNVGQDGTNVPAPTITNPSKQQMRESAKNCEILEIVNLYPPIVDITSATVTEVQPYEITIPSVTTATATSDAFAAVPSSSSSSTACSTQFVNSLKVENTTEMETDQDEYYLPESTVYINTLEEHSYTKLPIQADDNKDEIFHDMTFATGGHWFEAVDISNKHKHDEPQKRTRKPARRWACAACDRRFTRQRKLLHHRAWECSSRKKLSVECPFCRRKFPSWVRTRSHICLCPKRLEKHRQYKWRAILERSKYRRVFKERGEQGEIVITKYACSLCDRSYSNSSNLRRHFTTHRPQEQWNHKCGVCFRIFDKLFDLKRHLQLAACADRAGGTVPKSESQAEVEQSAVEERPSEVEINHPTSVTPVDRLLYVCSTCNKMFQSYNSLKVHEPIHTGTKAYICETCGKRFSGPSNLWQHRLTHSEERQYSCKQCPKVFKRKGGLSQHVRAIHMKIKPYQCPTCGHEYALKADMSRCRHSRLNDPVLSAMG